MSECFFWYQLTQIILDKGLLFVVVGLPHFFENTFCDDLELRSDVYI